MAYKLDRVDEFYGLIKSQLEGCILGLTLGSTIYVNFNKLRKKGFYRVEFSLKDNKYPSYCESDVFCRTQELNTKESFELADKLSEELWKKIGFFWSIGDLADLSKTYRKEFLEMEG